MTGNATFEHRDVALLAVTAVEAPVVVPSQRFDEQLATHAASACGCPRACSRRVAGVHRAALVGRGDDVRRRRDRGRRARRSPRPGVDPGEVGLLINTSVTRTHLEPSVAVAHPRRAGPAVERAELRHHQRVPRVRQRPDARGAAHRRRPDRLRGDRRRRGPAPDAGGDHPRGCSRGRLTRDDFLERVRDPHARRRRRGRRARPGAACTPARTASSAASRGRPPSTTSCASAASTA